MIGLGLSRSQQALYSTALRNDHTVKVRVSLLDRNENHAVTFPTSTSDDSCPLSIIGGQVDVDTTQGATAQLRKLTISILDPLRKLVVQNGGPEYAIWANTFIQVERGDYVTGIGYVWCPVFTGPIQTMARSHPEVTITAVGKEVLAQAPYGVTTPIVLKRGVLVTTAIRTLMAAVGETNFAMSGSAVTLPKDRTVKAFDSIWAEVLHIAQSSRMFVFYDGRGQLRLEPRTKGNPAWTFNMDSERGMLLSAPDESYDFTGGQPLGGQQSAGTGGAFANYVDVVGAPPTKKVPQPHAARSADGSNDLSPGALGRNGKGRYAIISITDTTLKTQADAATRATDILTAALEVAQSAKFEAMPVPHLEEYDWVTVQTISGDTLSVQMNTFSMPLGADAMSVGTLRQMAYTRGLRAPRVHRITYGETHKSRKSSKKHHG